MKPNNYYLAIVSITILFNIPTISNAKETKTTTIKKFDSPTVTRHPDSVEISNESKSHNVTENPPNDSIKKNENKENRLEAFSVCDIQHTLCNPL